MCLGEGVALAVRRVWVRGCACRSPDPTRPPPPSLSFPRGMNNIGQLGTNYLPAGGQANSPTFVLTSLKFQLGTMSTGLYVTCAVVVNGERMPSCGAPSCGI